MTGSRSLINEGSGLIRPNYFQTNGDGRLYTNGSLPAFVAGLAAGYHHKIPYFHLPRCINCRKLKSPVDIIEGGGEGEGEGSAPLKRGRGRPKGSHETRQVAESFMHRNNAMITTPRSLNLPQPRTTHPALTLLATVVMRSAAF